MEVVRIRPYKWQGPYAEMRSSKGSLHDSGLCAEVRAPWMRRDERIIVRSCEIVGYETGYLYDDHFPTFDSEGRGKGYEHIPFRWKPDRGSDELSADCVVYEKGRFWLNLRSQQDFIDIELGLRNSFSGHMGNIDWHFCVVGYDSASIGDSKLERTFLFDGQRLRRLLEMSGSAKCEMYLVAGANGFLPTQHRDYPRGRVEAKASVVIVESVSGKHSVALGFQKSYCIFSNPINKCFHANPYWRPVERDGEERVMRGKLYLMEGTAQEAFERYKAEFSV